MGCVSVHDLRPRPCSTPSMGFTGHAPYDWPAPNGYPDTREAWSGSSSYAMTWKLLNWLTETQDNAVPLAPILATTRSKVPSWTANALVDYWCQRLLGYQPTAARKQTLVAFMRLNSLGSCLRGSDGLKESR